MKTLVIACEMMRDEIEYARKQTGLDFPIRWLEPALHTYPARLHVALQEIFDTTDAERVLMLLGSCGNGTQDLQVRNFELIFPRVDDCVSMLIGSVDRRIDMVLDHCCLFLTDGWLNTSENVWQQYLQLKEEFGEENARIIYDSMYANYRSIALLDTPASSFEHLLESSRPMEETLGLQRFRHPVTTEYIEQLLTGPWPEKRFIRKAPNTTVTMDDMLMCQGQEH